MVLAARRLLGAGVGRCRVPTRAVLSAAAGGRRAVASLGLAAGAGVESLLEVGDGLVQGLLVGQRSLLADLLEHARWMAPQKGDELLLEAPHRGRGDVVDEAVGAGV